MYGNLGHPVAGKSKFDLKISQTAWQQFGFLDA